MSGDIIEIHVDTCAMLRNRTVVAVDALKKLYDATGMAQLHYVETEQGLREKTDRTNRFMLDALDNDLSRHGKFLRSASEWMDVVPTRHCDMFLQMLHEKILPETTWKVVEAVEHVLPGIQRTAWEGMKRRGDPVPEHPSQITFPFTHYTDNAGRRRGKRIDDELLRKSFNSHRNAWREEADHVPFLRNMKNSAQKGTLISFIRAIQETRAIAFELALRLEPEVMQQHGYTESPLGIPLDKPLNIEFIKEHAHLYPPLPLRGAPFNEMAHKEVMDQALRMTDLWPWQFKPFLVGTPTGNILSVAHFNRADNAILEYFLKDFAGKPDVDNRIFLLVTHDGPLIQEFTKLREGNEWRKKPFSDEMEFAPVHNGHYLRFGVNRQCLAAMPEGEALTSGGFVTFLEQEIGCAERFADRPGVMEAIYHLKEATRTLKQHSHQDRESHPGMAGLSDAQHLGPLLHQRTRGKAVS